MVNSHTGLKIVSAAGFKKISATKDAEIETPVFEHTTIELQVAREF
tara:strand:+ start:12185 stop:12322 length:138 start_codon:yes stop_codon:yes gene_type:complete